MVMQIIITMRVQDAVYWAPAPASNEFGKPTYPNGPVALSYAQGYGVRWEDDLKEVLSATGRQWMSKSTVYVPQLPDGSEVQVGGVLWLGNISKLIDPVNPFNNPGAYEVKMFCRMPTLDGTQFLRTALL